MNWLKLLIATIIIVSISIAGIKQGEIREDNLSINQTINQQIDNTRVHRVVAGMAAVELGPTFYRNDWDEFYVGSFANLTQEEIAYLDTLRGLRAGVWHYIDVTARVHIGNQMPTDRITTRFERIFIDDGEIRTTINREIKEGIKYQLVLQVYDYSPIILDLDNNRKVDVAYNYWLPHAPKFFQQNIVSFDITGDQIEDLVEWVVGPNDGLLVAPESKTVKSALDLFGTAGGFSDGYEKLKLYDKDKNGFVDGKELEGFKVWIDKNMNAKVEEGELVSIKEYKISKISVNHNGKYVSFYETEDGKRRLMWDWWPAAIQVKSIKSNK
ncbi:MAG: EF-hand domain-containing protein [bacterium]